MNADSFPAAPPDSTESASDAPLLLRPVQAVRGVGDALAVAIAPLGLRTLGDLLRHYPRRYEDRARFAKIEELEDGQAATIAGKVTAVENRPMKARMVITKVTVEDGSRVVATLTWFNQWRMKTTFEKLVGRRIVAYGTVKRRLTSIEITQPEWEALDEEAVAKGESLNIGRIVPIYPLTEGIGQNRLRKIIHAAVMSCADAVVEPLSARIRHARDLPKLSDALRQIHFPDDIAHMENARRRLVYDELLTMQLLLAGRKLSGKGADGVVVADVATPIGEFEASLPFAMTNAQKRVVAEIGQDMQSQSPMNRLVQGDVGSGKTAVAMAAMLIAVRNGCQAAMMAPTEILAEQHGKSIRRTLEPLGVGVELLTGSLRAKEKAAIKERLLGGQSHVVVGTHALIQSDVAFHRLGLVVIDEQHRFGVLQRAALSAKGASGVMPDVLVMTATPIPRTLTLTVYGDLDTSIIDELPPGRKPIRTHWKRATEKDSVYEGVRKMLAQGRQAFVVCPLIEESEKLQVRAASDLATHLTKSVFPEYIVGLLHGQMSSDDKDDVMNRFRAGEIHLLVATTVIEVGVDVPNAVVMVIEDADRFGLAQLHQLRGRVGRGQHASFCILIAEPTSETGERRMQVMTETNDGFRISEEDLRLRGPGEFYGTRQSGLPALQIADVLRDTPILLEAREDAFVILDADPKLASDENRALRETVMAARRRVELPAEGSVMA